MPYPMSEDKIMQKIAKVRELEEEVGKKLIEVDSLKEDIEKYMTEKGLTKLKCSADVSGIAKGSTLVATKRERATVTYDADKLKKSLDKDVYMEVVDRIYTVRDINEMIKLVKGAGINAAEFKGLLNVTQKPNNAKIKFLYDNGELAMDDIKGCFTIKISKTLKVAEVEGEEA